MIADDLRKAIGAIERLDPKWTLPSNIHSCSEGAITFTKGTDDGVITGTIQAWMGGGEYNYFVVLDVKQNSTVLFHGKYLRRQPRISRMNVFLEKRTVYDEEFTEDFSICSPTYRAIYQPLKTELKRKADAIEAAKNARAQAMKRKFFHG